MSDDVLDSEVSLGVEVATPAGMPVSVKGKAKSRFISAADRLLGNLVDYPNAWLEHGPAIKRAETKAAVAAVESKNQSRDIGFVQAAVDKAVAQAVRNQEKKILLLQEAVEDLKQRPPEENEQGTEELSETFLNRMEKRVEEATEEEIRAKWGKVLAAEIRTPGTFSAKVMRIVDEIEPETAQLFEKVCRYRLDYIIPNCMIELPFLERKMLEDAGLLIVSDAEISVYLYDREERDKIFCYMVLSDFGFRCLKYKQIPESIGDKRYPIVMDTKKDLAAIDVYQLTGAGQYIASLFEDIQAKNFAAYLKKLSYSLPDTDIQEYSVLKRGKKRIMKTVRFWRNGSVKYIFNDNGEIVYSRNPYEDLY